MLHNAMVRLALSSASLSWEASQVIALRMMRIAAGGAKADKEMSRLIPEKIAALIDAQMSLGMDIALGRVHRSPQETIAMYRRRVRSNYRRLARPKRRRAGGPSRRRA
jgi:hypothetical protein